MTNITINMIEDRLLSLDTEYRESLAHCLMDKKYLSASPLQLSMGTEKQQKELEKVYNQKLTEEQVNEILDYISNDMRNDFQYGSFKRIASEYYFNEKDEVEEEIEM